MANKAYYNYLDSAGWRDLRDRKFDISGRFCRGCGTHENIHVHHIRYRHLIDCVPEDLIVLCKDCHKDIHSAMKLLHIDRDMVLESDVQSVLKRFKAAGGNKALKKSKRERAEARRARRSDRKQKMQPLQQSQTVYIKAPKPPMMSFVNTVKKCIKQSLPIRPDSVKVLISKLTEIMAQHEDKNRDRVFELITNHSATDSECAKEPAVASKIESEALQESGHISITRDMIESFRTPKGGFTAATTNALGLAKIAMSAGWPSRLVGTVISKKQYDDAIAGTKILASNRMRP